ncbi:MAG: hypothetical protein ACT4QB_12110 [Gammaproteobacteria bacterium]
MLMIGNPTPDLEVETLMPDGRFERLRLVQAFQAGGLTACEWHPSDGLLVPV